MKYKAKQPIYYSANSLYMFRVSTTPITTSTQNCNYSLRYLSATFLQRGQASWPRWREVAAQKIRPVPEAARQICSPLLLKQNEVCVFGMHGYNRVTRNLSGVKKLEPSYLTRIGKDSFVRKVYF